MQRMHFLQLVLPCLVTLSAYLSCGVAAHENGSRNAEVQPEHKRMHSMMAEVNRRLKDHERHERHRREEGDAEERGREEAKEREEEGEAAEEEGEKEEAEEEEEHFTRRDVHDSAMLIGAVLLVGSLFYLVNWPDDDIRLYTMRILSSTMSIFSAVLMYQGINQVVEVIIEELSPWVKCIIQFAHCSLYITLMQLAIARYSGVIFDVENRNLEEQKWTIADGLRADFSRELEDAELSRVRFPDATKTVWMDPYDVEVPVTKVKVHLEQRHRQMKCWATIFSHMSGFAAINAGGWMQHTPLFSSNPPMAFIPAILTQVVLLFMFEVSVCFRQSRFKALQGDHHTFRRAALCRAYCLEAENDVCALSWSFLVVQAGRFAVSGTLPNLEGLEEPGQPHTTLAVMLLYGIGVLGSTISIILALSGLFEEEEEAEELTEMPSPPPRIQRFWHVMSDAFAMVFAWSMLFGTRWLFDSLLGDRMAAVQGRICLALALSIVSVVAVFGLDTIDDALRAQGQALSAATVIRIIIGALAILIGFSWESSFDVGVAAVSSSATHRRLCKFLLGTIVFTFLVPAWRSHILTKQMALEAMKKARQKFLAASTPMDSDGPSRAEEAALMESSVSRIMKDASG